MADGTDARTADEEPRSHRACAYCPQLGADVCVREYPSASGGSGYAIYAHRACAQANGDTILWVPTERAS